MKLIPQEFRDKVDKFVHCVRCGRLYEIVPIDPDEVQDWKEYEELEASKIAEYSSEDGGIFMICHQCKLKINTRLDWIEAVAYKCAPRWLSVRLVSECEEDTCKE